MNHRFTILCLVVLAAILAVPAHARNLVRNSDFSRSFSGGGPADGWAAGRTAQGGVNARDSRGGVDGGACHRLSAPGDASAEWYICSQVIRGLSPGDRGVVSAYVRTDGAKDGGGAYIGLNYFNSTGVRITWTDSASHLTGTTGWERISQPFTVPMGTTRVELNLVIHGHGTAFFDRAQVEKGDAVTPWSPRDVASSDAGVKSQSVAIFRDDIPVSGTASDPARLRKLAEAAGYRCAYVRSSDLADPTRFSAGRYRVVILPCGGSFPADAADNLRTFFEDGGSLLTVGGYPFDRPMLHTRAGWRTVADAEPDASRLRTLIDQSASPRWVSGGHDIPERVVPAMVDGGRRCFVFGTPSMPVGGWSTLASPTLTGLPAGSCTLAFRARSAAGELPMAVEIAERDGARWRSVVTVTPKWHIHQVDLASLEYWKDNPSVGRGGPGDTPHMQDVVAVRFGITTEFVTPGKPYEARIAEVWTSADAPPSWARLRMNSATGGVNPATFLVTDPGAISICDAGSPISDASRVAASSGIPDLPSGSTAIGEIRGCSATGQTALGDPGAPVKSRWSPMVDALDRYGRKRGTAFATMWNFGGSYPGSVWAYSGISNQDLFRPGNRFGESIFRAALARMTRGVFLYDAQATPACARQGERIVLRARVGNVGSSARQASVKLIVECGGRRIAQLADKVSLPARGSAPVEFSFQPKPGLPDGLLKLRLSVEATGIPSDSLDCGAVAWSPERQARGAKIAYRDCYFDRGRGSEFMLGTQIYWGGSSITGSDPLRWAEQLGRMTDNGISVTRCFMNVPGGNTEDGWRKRDAMVQLAQEAGISVFYEGISWPNESAAENDKQAQVGKTAAERYKSAPGWFVDIRNEPWMPVTATGPDAQRVMSNKMRDWAARTRAAIVSADPKRLVSVGYLPGLGYGTNSWDPIVGSRDLDFANRHYYGTLADFAVEVKQIDLRLLGKAPSVGEFGCTSHPGLRTHFVYETEDDAMVRYAYTPHVTFGLGGTFCSNWHWQDPIEDIFPCGTLLSDGAARDRLQPYRNSGVLLRTIRPRYEHPAAWFVIPDSRLSPRKEAVEAAMNRVLKALICLHVEFGVVQEEDLSRLPAQAKALIWPVAGESSTDDSRATLRIPETIQSPTELRSLVVEFLSKTAVRRHALTPDVPELLSFRVAGESGSVAHVLWNTTSKPIHATLTDLPKRVEMDLAPRSGGYVAFDGRGAVIAVEGRSVSVGGKAIVSADSTVGAISLDGRDLLDSDGVLILPFRHGQLHLFGKASSGTVSIGEVTGARWTEYERVTPQHGALSLDSAMARSWLIAGTSSRLPAWGQEVARGIAFPGHVR